MTDIEDAYQIAYTMAGRVEHPLIYFVALTQSQTWVGAEFHLYRPVREDEDWPIEGLDLQRWGAWVRETIGAACVDLSCVDPYTEVVIAWYFSEHFRCL